MENTRSAPADWISVADLEKGFATESFALDHTAALSGQSFELHDEAGRVRNLHIAEDHLSLDGGSHAVFRVTSLRDGIYFLDWLDASTTPETSYSLVLDTVTKSYTQVIGKMPGFEEINEGLYFRALKNKALTYVDVEISHGSLDSPYKPDACPHESTTELVGIRNIYRYSPTEVYEHTYLNPHFYTWQCLKGVEQGLCDTDLCHYYKIAEKLYLFIWQEKIVPTLGVIMIDEVAHRSDGKICGLGDTQEAPLSNFPVASYCERLNTAEYPNDL